MRLVFTSSAGSIAGALIEESKMKIQPKIYNITINETTLYGSDKTREEFKKAQEKFINFDFLTLLDFNEEELYSKSLIESTPLVLSKDQMFELSVANIGFTVIQEIKIDVDITEQLIELAEKPIKLIQENNNGATYNNKCEVHMPGHSLSIYNEMLIKEDCCTDELQSELNSGWRIIAACPQPDQRRPDYIMGRFNPNLQVSGDAKR